MRLTFCCAIAACGNATAPAAAATKVRRDSRGALESRSCMVESLSLSVVVLEKRLLGQCGEAGGLLDDGPGLQQQVFAPAP